MSLFDRTRVVAARCATAAALVGAMALAGCQVRPLYADSTTGASTPVSLRQDLSQIAIKPVNTRYGQQVRNELIYLFNGGKGQATASTYAMDLVVTASHSPDLRVQSAGTDDNEPTAGSVIVAGTYIVIDSATSTIVARGRRQAIASYDVPQQQYAAARAKIDAENRAAKDLARLLQVAIAQDFAKR